RLLTNGGSRLEEIVVDGQKMIVKPAVKTQKPISVANEIEIEAETLFGKTSFGIYLVVPTGTTKTLRINYVAGGKIDIAGFLPKITFLRQKQMGIDGISWNIHFLAPEGTKLRGDGFSLLADGREMEYNNLLKEDTSFSVEVYRP
ncbi:MAG: hypothetical protein Q8N98_00740, partial [bacterium]|nr:hypothetical protein [bacterium]